jgi:hypothetical protein
MFVMVEMYIRGRLRGGVEMRICMVLLNKKQSGCRMRTSRANSEGHHIVVQGGGIHSPMRVLLSLPSCQSTQTNSLAAEAATAAAAANL